MALPTKRDQRIPTKRDQRILELYRAFTEKNKYVAELFRDDPHLNPLQRCSTAYGNTFLHIAICFRQFELVNLLLETLPESLCNIRNDDGNTILHGLAASDEWVDTARKAVEKDPELLIAPNELKETPIFSAVRRGQFSMFVHLVRELQERYQQNPEYVEKCLERDEKTTVLHAAVTGEYFELAYYIARRCSYLIPKKDEDGMTAFQYLACNNKAFKGKKRAEFLEDSALTMKYKPYKDKSTDSSTEKPSRLSLKGLLDALVKEDTTWLSIDSQTISSSETAKLKCKTIESAKGMSLEKNMQEPNRRNFQENEKQRYEEYKKSDESPLFLAIMSNNLVVVEAIVFQHPNAIKHTNKDGMNVLQTSILYGNIKIFDLITNLKLLPHSLLSVTDKENNSLLHMVCQDQKIRPDRKRENPALQLRRECIFFKTVKAACSMHIRKPLNNCHQTPEELFAAKNQKLHREAKEWMRRTSENCIILSVFIATVAFAAIFTVPGGPDQKTGIPLLNSKPWFMVFIVADVISLTLALTSVGIFLSILTSSFPLRDYENSLFKKLRHGIVSMVLSISMMVVAFGATVVLAMTHNWEIAGWIVVGFLPVPIFFLSYSSLRSAVLGPYLKIFSTFTAKFRLRCMHCPFNVRDILAFRVGEAVAGVHRNVERAFSWICGQKSVERGNNMPPI